MGNLYRSMYGALDYPAVLTWALALLASFFGYGLLLVRVLRVRTTPPVGVGLQMAWGMALVLSVGGWLCAFSLAQRPVLIGLALLGMALACTHGFARWRGQRAAPGLKSADLAWLAVPALLAVLWLAASIAPRDGINPNDDAVAYLTYVTRILETGDLVEPYGFRRLTTFGGHSLLQALVMAVGSELNANVPDIGLASLLLVVLFAGLVRPERGIQKVCAGLLLTGVLLIPVPRSNTASVATGAVLLVALVSTLQRLTRPKADAGALAFLAGMTAAAAGALRPTFLAAAVMALALFHLAHLARDWRSGLREGALSLLGGILGLAPWMVALYQSSGTPLFPLAIGNYQPGFETFSAGFETTHAITHIGRVLTSPSFLVIWMPILVIPALRRPGPILALAIGSVIASMMTIQANGAWSVQNHYRHTWPLLLPASLGTAALAIREWSEAPSRGPRPLAVAIVALLLFVPALQRNLGAGVHAVRAAAARLPSQWRAHRSLAVTLEDAAYAEAQAATPPGASLLTVVDRPFLLDYRRNAIFNIDAIGAASPPPGMPFYQGPDALRAYLLGQSIEWVLARDFDAGRGIYSRAFWRKDHPAAVLDHVWRPHFLDFMNNLDQIAQCDEVVTQPMGNRLIRLHLGGKCARSDKRARSASS